MLATAAGFDVTAHHVDHGHRSGTAAEAAAAHQIADALGVRFRIHHAQLEDGPNFEATARRARHDLIGVEAMFGHTADDLAETVLHRLLRGTGPDGLAAMRPSPRHPILRLRRDDTKMICAEAGVTPIDDPSNSDTRFVRNRIRHELLPLASDIAQRDIVPLLARLSELAAEQRDLVSAWTADIDPTDAPLIASLPLPLARQAIRTWIAHYHPERYNPDLATVDRVLAVARGASTACEIPGGLRIERTRQRLRVTGSTSTPQR